MAGRIFRKGEGIDFNDKTLEGNVVYAIGNLKAQTTNYPISSGAAVLYYKIKLSNATWDLILGIDAPLMYGRYTYSDSFGAWNNLLE